MNISKLKEMAARKPLLKMWLGRDQPEEGKL